VCCDGDEIDRTQGGHGNAYAQDNETSWFDWNLDGRRRILLEFTRMRRAFDSGLPHHGKSCTSG